MCESSVFLEDKGEIREIMNRVSRIVMEGEIVAAGQKSAESGSNKPWF